MRCLCLVGFFANAVPRLGGSKTEYENALEGLVFVWEGTGGQCVGMFV